MKKWFLNMLVVGVLGALAVSCSDEYDELGLDSRKAQVMFSVAMDTPSARSRATWGENQNSTSALIGDDFDNKIDLNQLTVKIDAGGKTYYVVNPIKWKVEGTKNEYKIVGIVDGIDKNTTLTNPKFTVYANMDENQNKFGATYSAETPNGVQSIPMWGVMTYDGTLNFELGKRVDIGNIYLLRAMAKVEVALTEEMNEEYDLVGATLNKYNGTGYCLPDDDASNAANTTSLELEEVFNPYADSKQELSFNKVGNSYVVYLPEVANGTSESDYLNIEVELKAKGASEAETGNFKIMDYTTNPEAPTAIDIVRNHWYKYTISGFSASEVQVNYQTVDWQPINIEIGGEGFLFLNKDVIEIYNSNIDADQLKFSSSSPIKSIVLKDSYKHYRNGDIMETPVDEEPDNVFAYYMDKFGVLTQLSNEEGSDEAIVLENITAAVKEENKKVLNGGIVINSPFMADKDASETVLQNDSHDNTIRYLEFEVTNEQNLTATFRVMQYPPVIITNQEGYFSYRDDQKYSDDQEEASHFHNYMGWKSFHLSGLMWYRIFDWTNVPYDDNEEDICLDTDKERDYSAAVDITDKEGCEVVHYGVMSTPHAFIDSRGEKVTYNYGGVHRSTVSPADAPFLRHRYLGQENTTGIYRADSKGNPTGYKPNKSTPAYYHDRGDVQGLAFGPIYEEEIDGKIRRLRKKYVWNVNPIFYNLYVDKVHQVATTDRKQGQADIHQITHATTTYYGEDGTGWSSWGRTGYINHRMYHVKTTVSSSEYTIGNIDLLDKEGKPTKDPIIGVTANSARNANIISPSFMVASQLGETNYQSIITSAANLAGQPHTVPNVGTFYKFAVDHCREYVETTYKDENNNYQWDEGEPITHYHDWRLPTKAEIDKIIELQETSRAMDKLLVGEYYFCATGAGEDADPTVKDNWISNRVDGFTSTKTGYYIRCVRDVKPNDDK